jgi:hypothetical protein
MNKEQQELLDEAYENYCKSFENQTLIEQYSFDTDPMIQLMFLNKCKTDTEFSERWGLKIEERELSDEESIFHYEKELYSPLRIIDPKIPVMPNKLITITYNDTKLESYE